VRRFTVLACTGLIVAGCAGRQPIPVSAYLPDDAGMSCEAIDAEIRRNNDALRVRVDEDAETQNKNIMVGTAAALLFLPIAFAMDFKGAASTEANAFEQRNATLSGLAVRKRCPAAPAMTVAQAVADREAKIAASRMSDGGDAPGIRTPTDQRLHQASVQKPPAPEPGVPLAAAQSLATEPVAEPAIDRARLRDLMNRFLRGELTEAEYHRLRAG